LPDHGNSVGGQPALHRCSYAPEQCHRFVGEKGGGIAAAEHCEAARLVEFGSEFGEELVVAQTDRHGDTELGFDLASKRREELGGTLAVQLFGAAEIEKSLVDRKRLDEWRHPQHRGAHSTPDVAVFRHVWPDHDRIRARRQRLEHRHRRAHAVEPRHITAGEDNPAGAAADDHGTIGEIGPFAFFDCGIKGVAIDMGDRQGVERGVRNQARRAAVAAPLGGRRREGEGAAIAAQRHHHSSSGRHSEAAPRTPLESPWTGGSRRVTT
jgi:hypothetical protein